MAETTYRVIQLKNASGELLTPILRASTNTNVLSAGNDTKLIWLNNGIIQESTGTVGTATKPIFLSGGSLTASDATVGSGVKPIFLSSGSLTASTSTTGGTANPVYLNGGSLTPISATVGDNNKPVYLSSGTITASNATIGNSTSQYMYLSSGVFTSATIPTLSGSVTASTNQYISSVKGEGHTISASTKAFVDLIMKVGSTTGKAYNPGTSGTVAFVGANNQIAASITTGTYATTVTFGIAESAVLPGTPYVGTATSANLIVTKGELNEQMTSAMHYKGTVSGTSAAIPAPTGAKAGDFWKVSAISLGTGTIYGFSDCVVGDALIYNGTSWEKIPAGDSVVTDGKITLSTSYLTIGTVDGKPLTIKANEASQNNAGIVKVGTNLAMSSGKLGISMTATTVTAASGAQTPEFNNTFNIISEIKQGADGKISGTTNTVKIPSQTALTTEVNAVSSGNTTYVGGLSVSNHTITYTTGTLPKIGLTTNTSAVAATTLSAASNNPYVSIYTDNAHSSAVKLEGANVINVSGNGSTVTFSHASSAVSAGSYGPTAAVSFGSGTTINIPNFTVTTLGHITAASQYKLTIPSNDDVQKVKQIAVSTDADYPILLKATAGAAATTGSVQYDSDGTFAYNPANNTLKIGTLVTSGTLKLQVGSGVLGAGSDGFINLKEALVALSSRISSVEAKTSGNITYWQ